MGYDINHILTFYAEISDTNRRNGELKDYLAAGTSKEDFSRRLKTALGVSHTANTPTTESTPAVSVAPAQGRVYPLPVAPSRSAQPPRDPSPVDPPPPSVLQSMPERNARLEAQRKEAEAQEKAKKALDAKARKEKAESSNKPGTAASADMKYAQMQKKRQADARAERARILKLVEDDKAERKEREANRKAEAKALADSAAPQWAPQTDVKPLPSKYAVECAIQVRLFDGSTIRSRFSSQGNLIKDVRPWIDSKQEGDTPYIFKQVLTPLPNKNIETSEEERTLASLGLSPSATLILVPVQDFTNAYASSGGLVSRGVSTGYGIVSSGFGMVTGVLSSFLGGTPQAPNQETQEPTPAATPRSNLPSVKMRTMHDGKDERKDDQQFYNGNAVSIRHLFNFQSLTR
jgi:hypothetical protein